MARRVTVQDIADELGLSRNTVSKALNNAEGLAEATRVRIIQKAVEMGYKQFAAPGLVAATSAGLTSGALATADPEKNEVAVLSAGFIFGSHFATLMLDVFQSELAQLGYSLSAHRTTAANLQELTLPFSLDLNRVAAIVCIETFDYDYASMLCALDTPTLFVDGPTVIDHPPLKTDMLIMNNSAGIIELVRTMLSRGIERIGFIGDYTHCESFFERYMAFRNTMLLSGKPVDESHYIRANHMQDIAEHVSTLDTLPELFICANDFVAIEAIQVLRGLGHLVPEEVLIAGFDDALESRSCMPPLTTIHIHTQIMAYSAVQLITSRLSEPSLEYRTITTQTDLIWRASTERN